MPEHRAVRRQRIIPAEVDFERIATIYRLTPSQVFAGVAYSLLVAYVMWGVVSPRIVVGWLVFRVALCIVRVRECHRFARDPKQRHRIGHWRTRFLLLMLLEAPSWSAIALLFVPHMSGDAATILYASVLIVPAVGLFSLVSHFPTAVAFVLMVITPLVVTQLLDRDANTGFVVGGLLVYVAILVYEAWRSDARWVELARLRVASQAVADERERARQLAEDSSLAKSAFLANMSHEIRTPLNGMMGLTELLLRGDLSVEQRGYLELSRTSSEHLLKLVEQVLDMSKINAGGIMIDVGPYNPHTLAAEVVHMFCAQAARGGVELRCRVEPSVPTSLIGDALRLRQVLANLVGNAVKFTKVGTITLSIGADAAENVDACVLHLAVTDTGPGIASEKQALVFQAFAQADASTTRKYGGTGLGLTISSSLVECMGSRLELDSTLGAGSRFHFTLTQPLTPSADERAGGATRVGTDQGPARAPYNVQSSVLPWATPRSRVTGSRGLTVAGARLAAAPAGVRILLAEDNDINALIATRMLQQLGAEVQRAENGARALDMFDAEPFDLVFMDVQMPVMDGYEATRRVREHERAREHEHERVREHERERENAGENARDGARRRDAGDTARTAPRDAIPIIALTANALPADRFLCAEAGMTDYLAKPIVPAELEALLLRYAPR